jgi:DNA adenine methylase
LGEKGNQYSRFNSQDQKELAEVFRKLDERNCKILLTNSDTNLVGELYSDYAKYTKEVDSIRTINYKRSKRGGHTELIIRNYS